MKHLHVWPYSMKEERSMLQDSPCDSMNWNCIGNIRSHSSLKIQYPCHWTHNTPATTVKIKANMAINKVTLTRLRRKFCSLLNPFLKPTKIKLRRQSFLLRETALTGFKLTPDCWSFNDESVDQTTLTWLVIKILQNRDGGGGGRREGGRLSHYKACFDFDIISNSMWSKYL